LYGRLLPEYRREVVVCFWRGWLACEASAAVYRLHRGDATAG